MRMVKGMRKRITKSSCKLDPDKTQDHAGHFISTFGGEPQGLLDEYTGENGIVEGEYNPPLITQEQVHDALKSLAFGKAACQMA